MNKLLLFSFLAFLLNPIDKNDSYIEKEVSNLSELIKNGKFEKGYILMKGDTIRTEILRFNRRKSINSFLFCVAKDRTDSTKIYTARQIEGYSIGNEIFMSQTSENANFFIRLNKVGKATLFERIGIPSDRRFLYFIKLPNYSHYFVICPEEQNISTSTMGGYGKNSPPRDIYNSKNINEKFKIFASTYLGDCMTLRNMVQSEFYTINDIPTIIDKYNKCNDK